MWDNAAITNAGAALIAQAVGENTLTISSAAAGTGTAVELQSLTSLSAQKQAMSIVGVEKSENNIKIQLQLTSIGNTQAYTLNQIGVWGSMGGQAALLAVYQNADGILMPTESDMPDFVFTFYANITVDNQINITASIDTSALVSAATLQSAIDDVTVTGAASTVVKNDLTANLVLVSDSNGKINDSDISFATLSHETCNILTEPLFDAHDHAGLIGTNIYPDDNGLINICTFWKAKISADESLWSAQVSDCAYDDQTINVLFINHPDEPTSALDGVYQVLELPGTDSFTAIIKLTFYAQVRDDDTPESATFTIRPYISNTLSAANGTNNGVTIPNDGAWHKVEMQGTVSNGTIYVVLDSFPAEEAAQHWFHLAMPKAEIVSLSDGANLLQTAKDAYLAKIDADLRAKISDDELYRAMLTQELEMTFPRFPVPADSIFDGTQASGVVFNTFANLLCTVVTGYIASMTAATKSIGVISDKYIGDIVDREVRYYQDSKWYVGSCDVDSANQITVTATASAQDVQFSILLSREAAEDDVPA